MDEHDYRAFYDELDAAYWETIDELIAIETGIEDDPDEWRQVHKSDRNVVFINDEGTVRVINKHYIDNLFDTKEE